MQFNYCYIVHLPLSVPVKQCYKAIKFCRLPFMDNSVNSTGYLQLRMQIIMRQQSAPTTSAAATWTRAALQSTRAQPQLYTSCPSELLCWKTKTSSLECCINSEVDCHNTPLTFISQCKLDGVLPVILIKFYVMLCYSNLVTGSHKQHYLQSSLTEVAAIQK